MRVVALAVLLVSSSACLFDPGQPSGIVVRCADDRDCRSPQVCDDGVCGAPDVTAPGQIVDLAVELAATTDVSLTLVFTAPGDDGNGAGDGPRRYRVTATPLLAGGTKRVVDVAATAAARERERIVVDGLVRGTVYSVVVEATDDAELSTTSAPLLAETGGALCVPDPVTGALTARGDTLTITRPEHLVRLYGCEVIEGSLTIVDEDCEITQLAALRNLRQVTAALEISGNELCGRGLVDVSDLAALESVEQLSVLNTGTLVDLSLNAAINSVTITSNRALARVSLPQRASAGGSGIDVQGNPSLTSLVAGVPNGSISITGNPILQTVAFDHFSTGNVDISWSPALTDVSLPVWADGELRFIENPSVAALSLPAMTTLYSVEIRDVEELAAFVVPSLERLNDLSIGDAPRLSELDLGTGSSRVVSLGGTALTTLPAIDAANALLLTDNPLLVDVAAVRVLPSARIVARNNPLLPPCAVLSLAATSGLDSSDLDIDLPLTPCPADTPLPSCNEGRQQFLVDGDQQLAPLVACGQIFGNLTLRNVTTTNALANLKSLLGELAIDVAPALTTLRLPALQSVRALRFDGQAPALTTIDLPALASVGFEASGPSFVAPDVTIDGLDALQTIRLPALARVEGALLISNNPRLTILDLGAIVEVDGSCEVLENTSLCTTDVSDVFTGLTCAAEHQNGNTGPC